MCDMKWHIYSLSEEFVESESLSVSSFMFELDQKNPKKLKPAWCVRTAQPSLCHS